MNRLPTLVELAYGSDAKFIRYQDGQLWYSILWVIDRGKVTERFGGNFDFPIPIDDAGGGEFLSSDKPIRFQRWTRKHLEFLKSVMVDRGEEDGS